MATTTNIVIGMQSENTLKIGAYGAAETAATDAGLLKGGISIEHDETHHEVKVDQALGVVQRITTDESMKVKVTLAESTLANLALAFGYGGDSVANGQFSFGGRNADTPRTLYINVNGPAGATRKYVFWKALPSGKTTHAYKKDGETVCDVEFEILTDLTKTAGSRFGTVTDTAAA